MNNQNDFQSVNTPAYTPNIGVPVTNTPPTGTVQQETQVSGPTPTPEPDVPHTNETPQPTVKQPQFGADKSEKTFKEVMEYQSVLPDSFDGTFRFSNPSDEDFIGIWGGKEYFFPAGKTVPMIMVDHSPLEIQHIRKKFAKDLAEREFYKSHEYKVKRDQEGTPGNRTMSGIHQAATYTLDDLTPYIQACLQPLEEDSLRYRPAEGRSIESKLHTDDEGNRISNVVDNNKTSLVEKARLNQTL